MVQKTIGAGRVKWRWALCAAIAGFVVLFAIATCQADTSLFLTVFVIAPTLLIMSIVVPIYAVVRNRRQFPPIAATLAVLWVASASFFLYNRENPFALRETARWFMWSQEYKREVLEEPTPPRGELKHIEWDASGFAGVADNTVYLVFDPADTPSAAAKSHQPAKVNGIPCEVRLVRRLESHWYSALFYTDQTWGHCN